MQVFGEQVIPGLSKPKHVTVILNPEANYKQVFFIIYPLLHILSEKYISGVCPEQI